jgi:hypothetical protein
MAVIELSRFMVLKSAADRLMASLHIEQRGRNWQPQGTQSREETTDKAKHQCPRQPNPEHVHMKQQALQADRASGTYGDAVTVEP